MLRDWLKENKITFPVGMIAVEEEKTRAAWGVKSLPWLILTDSSQRVIDEGFALEELGSKLKLPRLEAEGDVPVNRLRSPAAD